MTLPVFVTLAASGLFLFVGLIGGVLKYHGIMTSPNHNHRAHMYIDIAHRAALLYSFAALVMATLLQYSPYSQTTQLWITGVPLFFFAVSIAQYFVLGFRKHTTNQFKTRSFTTTWGMALLIVGELGGVGAIVWGFLSTQYPLVG